MTIQILTNDWKQISVSVDGLRPYEVKQIRLVDSETGKTFYFNFIAGDE